MHAAVRLLLDVGQQTAMDAVRDGALLWFLWRLEGEEENRWERGRPDRERGACYGSCGNGKEREGERGSCFDLLGDQVLRNAFNYLFLLSIFLQQEKKKGMVRG